MEHEGEDTNVLDGGDDISGDSMETDVHSFTPYLEYTTPDAGPPGSVDADARAGATGDYNVDMS